MLKCWMKMMTLVVLLAAGRLCAAANVSGKWIAEIGSAQGEPQYAHVLLQLDGTKVSGMWGALKIDGTLADSKLEIKLADEEGNAAGSMSASLEGDTFKGTGTITGGRARGGPGGGMGGGRGGRGAGAPSQITLTRAPVQPTSPRTVRFVPENFFATYSAENKPALKISPGDIVDTWTADAGGVDAKGVHHRGGDSNIGPFYVEGALPGDTLAIHLRKIRTNRSTARQGTRINPHAVTAQYLVGAKYDPAVTGEWTLLPDKGIAVPTHPSEHMKNYSVPLKPMLGCISVAPAGDEQFRGGDLGPFGGNMDYNDNVEGTTVYLPVFHPGALLGMGDGHAAMGDGEVTGGAVETSMDVEFSVGVIPGDSSGQPRAETKDYLIAFGISGSVPDSIQIATTQLATWIKSKYGLNDSEVAVLFASTLKYDVTELVDSKYNVVAKVPKSILAAMK